MLEILGRNDSAGLGFMISEPGFGHDLLCCQGYSLLCFGVFGVTFKGMCDSFMLAACGIGC